MNFQRLIKSAVVWSWINNGLRAVSGLVLMSLMSRELTTSEFGMSGILIITSALTVVFDFGFAPTVDRFIGYAMGGAKTLEAQGVPEQVGEHSPNYELIWELLATTRTLYRYLTAVLFVLMGVGGSAIIENLIRTEHALHPEFGLVAARWAWLVTLVSMLLDIYSNWWGVFLRGLNQVRSAAQVAVAATVLKCVISSILLVKGAGLLSLPIGTLVGSYVQRRYARYRSLQLLPGKPPERPRVKEHLTAMWPNSWRMGVQLLSSYLLIQANALLCAKLFHFAATGAYVYSVQLMNYAVTMATVWTSTKWPIISQYQARQDYQMIRRLLRPRIWLQAATFVALGLLVVFAAPEFLHWVGKDKELLPKPWMLLLMFSVFMDVQISMCGTLISTGNRMPYLWIGILSNVLIVALSLALLRFTALGVGSFVISPVLINVFFNYWFWPQYAARGLKSKVGKLLFSPEWEADAQNGSLKGWPAASNVKS